MQAIKQRLAPLGRVEAFDYPYMLEGRKAPDRLPALIAAHERALEQSSLGHSGPRVLVGKSMGGRIGCHVAVALAPATKPSALVCLGYPLVGRRGDVRDKVLLELETPVLFVQGSRDPLCPLEQLEAVRQKMRAPSALFVVGGGNHSLGVASASSRLAAKRRRPSTRA